jgi:uncharacterized membrane protein
MTRSEFLEQLRRGLSGMPQAAVDDIVFDYDTHFSDALAAGRTEADVAAALGDPGRLARELRAEAGMKSWEANKTPSSATSAIFGILGLGALDILILLPMLSGVAGTLVGLFAAAIGLFVVGGVVFAVGPFMGLPGGVFGALLGGFGLMAGALCVGLLVLAASIGLVNATIWYARLHYRVAKPALDAQAA